MPIKIGSTRKTTNKAFTGGIVFIFLGIFLTFQFKSAKPLLISLIGIFALILWWQRRKKFGPVTASQRIAEVITSIKRR